MKEPRQNVRYENSITSRLSQRQFNCKRWQQIIIIWDKLHYNRDMFALFSGDDFSSACRHMRSVNISKWWRQTREFSETRIRRFMCCDTYGKMWFNYDTFMWNVFNVGSFSNFLAENCRQEVKNVIITMFLMLEGEGGNI